MAPAGSQSLADSVENRIRYQWNQEVSSPIF